MPEQISRYPEVTIKILRDAGGRCGEGAEQKILTKCPPERFCSMPTGEVCVYGIDEIPMMTQITTGDLARVVSPHPTPSPPIQAYHTLPLLAAFAVGVVAGAVVYRLRSRR